MILIKTIDNSSNCKVGDIFKIEGVNKTIVNISKKYVYFDLGKPLPYKPFNFFARQCKVISKKVVNTSLVDKIAKLETFIKCQERTIAQHSELTDTTITENEELIETKEYLAEKVVELEAKLRKAHNHGLRDYQWDMAENGNPVAFRYILIRLRNKVEEDKITYEWVFAHKHTSHADMEDEFIRKMDNDSSSKYKNLYPVVMGGGFYASLGGIDEEFTKTDYTQPFALTSKTLLLFGESSTFRRPDKDDMEKALVELKKTRNVILLDEEK